MRKGRTSKVAHRKGWNPKVANRKGFRCRKARARLNRSKIQASVTMSEKEKQQLRDSVIPGRGIECSGSRNYYPKAVYFFMRKHCLRCELSFSTISDQILHMEDAHDRDVVCKRCYQPFPAGLNIGASHQSFVPESFQEELP